MSGSLKSSFIGIFLISALFVSDALSQETYPSRPITLVLWSSAGMADTVTRVICKAAERELGQPIIIETKPGAAGAIAINYVLKAKADGYTLGMAVTSNYIINSHVRKLPYDVLTDVTDIVVVCKYNIGVCVRSDAPWNTYEDLLAYAKKNPGRFTYSTAGVGTTNHICMERIAMKEGIKFTMVPFKSGGESVMACLGGHTDATAQGSVDVLRHLQAGKLKMLLVLDDKRWPAFPNVPSILEKGYSFYFMSYISYFGQKGLPEPIRQKLEDAFDKAKRDPAFIETLEKFQVGVGDLGGKEYSALWKSKYAEMGEVVKALGLVEK